MKITVIEAKPKPDRAVFTEARRFARRSLPRKPYLDTFRRMKERYFIGSVMDLGCGLGIDVAGWQSIGVEAYGIDGHDHPVLCDPSRYFKFDLRRPLRIHRVDAIHCREVAEHLPFEFADVLVRNIVRNGRACYFTAAVPGQIGSGHVNCQLPAFWQALFARYGWKTDADLTRLNADSHPCKLDRNALILYGERRNVR